ncbi:MAG: hypothetical protein KAR36_08645, partial [Candidatus Latescibacteria bacterium]|nr:hypothetical protein [Candidatus Latescibacterota bacterium]
LRYNLSNLWERVNQKPTTGPKFFDLELDFCVQMSHYYIEDSDLALFESAPPVHPGLTGFV